MFFEIKKWFDDENVFFLVECFHVCTKSFKYSLLNTKYTIYYSQSPKYPRVKTNWSTFTRKLCIFYQKRHNLSKNKLNSQPPADKVLIFTIIFMPGGQSTSCNRSFMARNCPWHVSSVTVAFSYTGVILIKKNHKNKNTG